MNDRPSSKEHGQSIVLVAVAVVALVMFVAITVDISFAYQQRRTAQNGADGAALAGVSEMATGINKKNKKALDGQIQAAMNDFAERNGVHDTDGTLANDTNENVDGWYVDPEGDRLDGEPMVGAGVVPDDAYGIEAITYITAPTFFGGIFGLSGLPLQARAVSLLKQACGEDCVVPITTDVSLLLTEAGEPRIGECFNIWRESQTEVPTPGLYGWISWTWQDAMCGPGGDGRPCPNIDQGVNACDSGVLEANLDPSNCASGFIQVGDWTSSTSGVINADDVRCWLLYYLGSHDEACNPRASLEPHPFTIPVYDSTTMDLPDPSEVPCLRMKDPWDPSTGGLHYHVAGFARMQLLGFRLSQGTSGEVSADTIDPSTCVTIGTVPHDGNRITAQFLEYVQDYDTSSACYDPLGTLLSAPRLNE